MSRQGRARWLQVTPKADACTWIPATADPICTQMGPTKPSGEVEILVLCTEVTYALNPESPVMPLLLTLQPSPPAEELRPIHETKLAKMLKANSRGMSYSCCTPPPPRASCFGFRDYIAMVVVFCSVVNHC